MKFVGLASLATVAHGAIPTVTIAPGVFMPLVGLGTWQYNDTTAYSAMCTAFELGYTYVDTAWGYGNEKGVGDALAHCWFGKGRKREDLFLMTKIPGGLNTSEVMEAAADNLRWLGLDYVDHLMTHFPCDWNETPERCNKARRQEEWQALEELMKQGKTRSIGVSHYCKQHIDDILEIATILPSINQVEWHVGSGDVDEVIDYCREKGIFFQSYSPLCGPCDAAPEDSLINGTMVTEIASHYKNVTGPQVALKYIVQLAQTKDHIAGVIPKASDPAYIKENIDLFKFTLSDADMATLGGATQPAGSLGDCDAP